MFANEPSASSHGVSVDMYNSRLLKLLALRAALEEDPAPELPRADGLPESLINFLKAETHRTKQGWHDYWVTVLDELSLPKGEIPEGGWAKWPESLYYIDDESMSQWRSTMHMSRPGGPLAKRPSYRYYQARAMSDRDMPYRLIVLPLAGEFSMRHGIGTGLVSARRFFGTDDPALGF